MKWTKLFRLLWKYLIKEYDKYVMVYSRGNYILCIRYFYFLKPDLIWKITEEGKSYRADEPSDLYA